MSHKKVQSIMAVHWSSSFLCATISFTLYWFEIFNRQRQFTFFLSLSLDTIILISAITNFMYFFMTVKKINGQEASVAGKLGAVNLLMTKFKIPCLIVLTYILFNLTSTVMLTSAKYEGRKFHLLEVYSHVPIMIGILSDSCIYVFANSNVRELLCSIFKGRRSANY